MKLKFPHKDPAVIERWLDLLHRAGVKWRWPTENPEALGQVWSALEYLARDTPEGNAQARQRFERAMALDPQYAAAHAFLGPPRPVQNIRQRCIAVSIIGIELDSPFCCCNGLVMLLPP